MDRASRQPVKTVRDVECNQTEPAVQTLPLACCQIQFAAQAAPLAEKEMPNLPLCMTFCIHVSPQQHVLDLDLHEAREELVDHEVDRRLPVELVEVLLDARQHARPSGKGRRASSSTGKASGKPHRASAWVGVRKMWLAHLERRV